MDDILFCQIKQPFKNVSDDRLCGLLCEMMSLSQFRLQISLIAKFCNNVAIAIAGKNLETSEDVGMIEFFKDIDFWEKELL